MWTSLAFNGLVNAATQQPLATDYRRLTLRRCSVPFTQVTRLFSAMFPLVRRIGRLVAVPKSLA